MIQNKEQLEKLIDNGKDQMAKKGVEINKFKEEHNIKIKGAQEEKAPEETAKDKGGVAGKSTVLVS